MFLTIQPCSNVHTVDRSSIYSGITLFYSRIIFTLQSILIRFTATRFYTHFQPLLLQLLKEHRVRRRRHSSHGHTMEACPILGVLTIITHSKYLRDSSE